LLHLTPLPLEKGGWEGLIQKIYFIKIPLNPPFSKGEVCKREVGRGLLKR
jgi:hypothetical protein